MTEEANHYYLGACRVVYTKRAVENLYRDLNSLVILKDNKITERTLAQLQQLSQVRFFNSAEKPSPDITVTDVFISNIIYLGHMTATEFANRPTVTEADLAAAMTQAQNGNQSEQSES